MQKLFTFFIALFVLFFACTQNSSETNDATTASTTTNQATPSEGLTPSPIPPPKEQDLSNYKAVPQAKASDLVYPKEFLDMGIPQFKGATMDNNLMLDNSQGKYGRRIKMTSTSSFDEVMAFYKTELEKNGWEQNTKMNQSGEDEDVKYFVTNYTKSNYTQMFTVIDLGAKGVSILQILKEN